MKQHVRRGRRRQAAPRRQRPRQHGPRRRRRRRPTAAARSSCRSSATPTRSTSPASSPPTRSSSARSRATSSRSTTSRAPTSSLTNPGTIGTVQSRAPADARPGRHRRRRQHRLPGRVRGRRPRATSARSASARSSRSPARTTTASSRAPRAGLFLKRVHELLLGEHGFYDDVFHALGMPYEAVKWRPDVNPIDREEAMLQQADAGRHADPRPPRPRPPHRRPRPAALEGAGACPTSSTRPRTA